LPHFLYCPTYSAKVKYMYNVFSISSKLIWTITRWSTESYLVEMGDTEKNLEKNRKNFISRCIVNRNIDISKYQLNNMRHCWSKFLFLNNTRMYIDMRYTKNRSFYKITVRDRFKNISLNNYSNQNLKKIIFIVTSTLYI